MHKIYIQPRFTHKDRADGGIRRVVEAQEKYLPQFDFEIANDSSEADIIAVHGTEVSKVTSVPVIAHNHGLYWDRYEWDNWAHRANYGVRESLRCAVAHTCPSEWVSTALRRGMLIYPEVVYHGVDIDRFKVPDEHQGYVLWNKARIDPVSNPHDMNEVAKLLPRREFVSTFGKVAQNVEITGAVPYEQMQDLVMRAGVYLATTRETFGIGTIEAMACGVPVVGWDWGGQSEIIVQGETGYLVPPNDYQALAQAIEAAFNQRSRLSTNARRDVEQRWLWKDKIEQYANLYLRAIERWNKLDVKVSVIVTCYNLAQYLTDCLNSVLAQKFEDWECVIVDDCSEDATPKIAHEFIQRDKRFKYYRTRKNLKLVGARNFGVHRSNGRYIIFLDADDMLEEQALKTLSQVLDGDSTLHIAYGHLDMVNHEGQDRKRAGWPYPQYSWGGQMAHYNQLPYSSMMRRRVFENTGGYRIRQWRAEDAEFWCRATSFGFRAAKVTEASTLIYRNRGDSKSKGEPGDGNWTAWFPWGLAAQAGDLPLKQAVEGSRMPFEIIPWGAQDQPFREPFWRVKDYAYPLISVVIPVGQGHERVLIDALDSLVAQNFPYWEAIVVNDTGNHWDPGYGSPVWGAPYVRVFDTDGKIGAGSARNFGARHARGEVLCFLDADDFLLPGALDKMWNGYKQVGGGIIYTDWMKHTDGIQELEPHETDDFKCGDVLEKMRHAVTALVPIEAHEKVGGFDEGMKGWEDWDYYIKLQAIGLCSYRIPEPLFVYRFFAGARREASFAERTALLQYIHDKWSNYYEGKEVMPCGSCPGAGRVSPPPTVYASRNVATGAVEVKAADPDSTIMLEYQGPHHGPVTFRGKVTGTSYRFGLGEKNCRRFVYASDAEGLLRMSMRGKPVFVKV